jgi:hypothetical protein
MTPLSPIVSEEARPIVITGRLTKIADFLEAHGRDEGGYSEDTRREFAADAAFLRQLVSRELATFDKNELLGLAICLETDEMTAAEAASYIRARWLEGKSSSGLATYPTASEVKVSREELVKFLAASEYEPAYQTAHDAKAMIRRWLSLTPDHDTREVKAELHNIGPHSTPRWFAFVNGEMLRDKRGVGRDFGSKEAALKAADHDTQQETPR